MATIGLVSFSFRCLGGVLFATGLVASFIFAGLACFWRALLLRHLRQTDCYRLKELMTWPMSKFTQLEESYEDTGDAFLNAYRSRFRKCMKLLAVAMVVFLIGLVLFYAGL